ncbi:MAG: S-layer homology domain-containing protein [Oscillospiraceae bacterium]|nr:S-layer homology domain-containing protein [Oscillospiraceae bacterium]
MFNLDDASKLAKNAMQGLAEKSGGNAGETAKSVLKGVKGLEKLAAEKAPEQVIAVLRTLLAEAKSSPCAGKNEALDACIQKAQNLLDGGTVSAEAATKLTAELRTLLKSTTRQPSGSSVPDSKPAASKNTASTQPAVSERTAAGKTPSAPAVQFSDVDAKAYYYDAVQWAVQQGIASGTTETTFSPDQNCTRAQTITLLWRSAGSPKPKNQNNPFTDVKDNAYYHDAVLWAAEQNIVSGTSFSPDEAVTRGQLAAFLYRKAGSPTTANNSNFTDVPNDAYYAQAVAWVAAQGIASGTGEHTFSPDAVCTRGQIVTFLYRASKK